MAESGWGEITMAQKQWTTVTPMTVVHLAIKEGTATRN
jgi:hypothetical protein